MLLLVSESQMAKSDAYGGIIVFCPDGTIPIVAYNCPGSVHDSMIAEWGGVYEK